MLLYVVAVIVGAFVLFVSTTVYKNKRTVYCHYYPDLRHRLAIVTGANTGIGKETARELAKRGARVILACRSVEKGRAAADDIRATVAGADVMVKRLDLASLESVKEFADDIRSSETSVDMLINNAGIFSPPIPYTEDGFETSFISNHLGHFLLTRLLLDLVENSEIKRVVVVSSEAYKRGVVEFDENNEIKHSKGVFKQYANTKLMNCLFAQELSRKVRTHGFAVFSLMPGGVKTDILKSVNFAGLRMFLRPILWFFMFAAKTAEQGCQTTVYCAIAPDIEHLSGSYFVECKPKPLAPIARDHDLANRLWQYSEDKVKRFLKSTEN